MKHYLILGILSLLLTSCSKNQKSVNKLDGNWYATQYNLFENGKKSNLLKIGFEFNYKFDNCKLKKNNYCQVTITKSNDITTDTQVLMYKVTDNGNVLEIKDPLTTKTMNTYRIEKLSRFKVKLNLIESTTTTEITLKKVN